MKKRTVVNHKTVAVLNQSKNSVHLPSAPKQLQKKISYSKSPHIRTYFFEREDEICSYFKGTNTSFKV